MNGGRVVRRREVGKEGRKTEGGGRDRVREEGRGEGGKEGGTDI